MRGRQLQQVSKKHTQICLVGSGAATAAAAAAVAASCPLSLSKQVGAAREGSGGVDMVDAGSVLRQHGLQLPPAGGATNERCDLPRLNGTAARLVGGTW